jgi:hypothetical protein
VTAPSRLPEHVNRQVDEHIREREKNGPRHCDVPGCKAPYIRRAARKVVWIGDTGSLMCITYFVCKKHMKMPRRSCFEPLRRGYPSSTIPCTKRTSNGTEGRAVSVKQLELFPEAHLSNGEAGLKSVPPGAERLLAELVKRGLPEGDLRVAASLCLVLDERAE